MSTEPTKPHKVIFDHGTHYEIADPEGTMRKYTRDQAETLKKLMDGFTWHTVVFKDYSRVRV